MIKLVQQIKDALPMVVLVSVSLAILAGIVWTVTAEIITDEEAVYLLIGFLAGAVMVDRWIVNKLK